MLYPLSYKDLRSSILAKYSGLVNPVYVLVCLAVPFIVSPMKVSEGEGKGGKASPSEWGSSHHDLVRGIVPAAAWDVKKFVTRT